MTTVALVGDRSVHVRAHVRLPGILEALRRDEGLALDAYWIPTEQAHETALTRFDAIWLLPGSPYRSQAGALHVAKTAREHGIAFLGTCGGFQHAMLEFARNVCGLASAVHAEVTPKGEGEDEVIVELACALVGHERAVHIAPGSRASAILGADKSIERYHCAYGLNAGFVGLLESRGMAFTGHDDDGEVRVAELPGHPFYLATLFQPELADEAGRVHPIIRAFARAAQPSSNAAG
ncbi:CTP synthase C-terminal region-related (seleno)protein [Allorhizocola rhizosphaerae]|uniref:CTP synthase C-terminal region-related (seleno)protein n=1 Tax=Allorhizocola rhizosphaerae TaxID=1872709 RepID=UPI000E3C5B62|nr:hypothetical protein [Allorhizocola rhizosphaerae]